MQGYGSGSSPDGLAHPNQVCRVNVLDVHILHEYGQARHSTMAAQCPLAANGAGHSQRQHACMCNTLAGQENMARMPAALLPLTCRTWGRQATSE